MQSLLGVTKKKRELAAHLGVDPYTDFEPLQIKMTQLSEAAAAGGLVVTGALMAIPGVGGIVATNVNTSSNLSPARARPLRRAADGPQPARSSPPWASRPASAETLLTNRSFTPLDTTVIVSRAREHVGGAEPFGLRRARRLGASTRRRVLHAPAGGIARRVSTPRPARSSRSSRSAAIRSTSRATAASSASCRSTRCHGPTTPRAR